MFWTALGEVLPQAVGIAVSPIPVVLIILVLVSPRPRRGGIAFASGWVTGVAIVAAVAFALSDGANVDIDPDAAEGGNFIQVLLGLVFVALAVRTWRTRPRPGVETQPPKILSVIDSLSAPKIFGLGFVAVAANPANLPLAIGAGLAIAQAGATAGQGLLDVAIFTVLASSTVLIPIAAFLLLGDRTREPLDALKTWLLANNSTILLILFSMLAANTLGSGLGVLD